MVTFEAYNAIDMFAYSFSGNWTILAEIQQIPYLALKIQDQDLNKNEPKFNQVM